MKTEFKVLVNGRLIAVEFGRVTKVPQRQELCKGGGYLQEAAAYATGLHGSRDVYLSLFAGYQVEAGLEYPILTTRKLDPGLKREAKVFFIRDREDPNEAASWGLVEFLDKKILEIAERPVYQLVRFTRLHGKPTSNPSEELGVGTIVQLIDKLGNLSKLPARCMDLIYEYHWSVRVATPTNEEFDEPFWWDPCKAPVRICITEKKPSTPPPTQAIPPAKDTLPDPSRNGMPPTAASVATEVPPAPSTPQTDHDPLGLKTLAGLGKNGKLTQWYQRQWDAEES